MIRRNATLAELDQPYRDAESRLTLLLCGPQGRLTDSEHAARADDLAAVYDELREIVKEMQLAVYREPAVPIVLGMTLRHALAGLDADAAFWRESAADHRAAEKRASMIGQRIEVG
jgi:hypothetical protein